MKRGYTIQKEGVLSVKRGYTIQKEGVYFSEGGGTVREEGYTIHSVQFKRVICTKRGY